MFNEKDYQAMFAKVTASPKTHREVLNMTKERNDKNGFYGRKQIALVAAVITLMAMTVTAFAAVTGAEWFVNYFEEKSGEELSESEIAYIENNTIDYNQSVTHNGYTVSVEYALTDGYTAYIKLKVTAPEGVVLNADDYGFAYKLKSQFYPADGSDPSRTGSWQMTDDNPEDNIIYFPMVWRGSGFGDGTKWILELEDFFESELREDGLYNDTVIAEGTFLFELVLSDISQESVELLNEPLSCTAKVHTAESEYEEVNIEISSIVLRPLSATVEFANYSDTFGLAGFGQLSIYMKDGSSTKMTMGSGGNGVNNYSTKSPVILSEVDYILLPDGTRVNMPELSTE